MKKIIMIVFGLIVLAVLAVALVGMYKFNYLANQPGYDVDGNKIEKTEPSTEVALAQDYVGLTVPQAQSKAKAEGTSFRVTMADGEALAATMDYRPGRINASVENGVVVSYSIEGQEVAAYDMNSWQKLIPDTCTSFFDGCNTCRREPGSDLAACTRMACAQYQAPKCLDEEV